MSVPIRVLIVDDSAFMRYTIAKHLEADPDITVIGSARDGLEALEKIPALKPDVVTLDVEMPRMDGLSTLKRLMADYPTPVIMLSSLTQRGALTTIRALMGGAVDFVAKPTASTDIRTVIEELAVKMKAVAGVCSKLQLQEIVSASNGMTRSAARKVGLRPFQQGDPVIVIGTSTGGPRALQEVLSGLPADLPAMILVVQHMPAGFTQSLARRLNQISALTVQEAVDGDRLARGLVLLAPGDFHLRLKDAKQVILDQGPRCHHVRPAVDITMESAIEYHKSAVIGVILTGMGSDGAQGATSIKGVGGKIIAEHPSTCVVYGMPRSVVEANLVDEIVPLPEIASTLTKMVNNGNGRI